MTKSQRIEMLANIRRHGENLNAIFNTNYEPLTLCQKLFRLERKANKLATEYCNGENGIDSENIDTFTKPILNSVTKILGTKYPIIFNGDARGYSLKISTKIVRENNLTIYTDWGGFGIIAPDFTPNN